MRLLIPWLRPVALLVCVCLGSGFSPVPSDGPAPPPAVAIPVSIAPFQLHPGALLSAACTLALLMAGGGGSKPSPESEPEDPKSESEQAAEERDRELLEQLSLLVSACPSCDRVLGQDEVWYHAASWVSLRQSLPRSAEPCPSCRQKPASD